MTFLRITWSLNKLSLLLLGNPESNLEALAVNLASLLANSTMINVLIIFTFVFFSFDKLRC